MILSLCILISFLYQIFFMQTGLSSLNIDLNAVLFLLLLSETVKFLAFQQWLQRVYVAWESTKNIMIYLTVYRCVH